MGIIDTYDHRDCVRRVKELRDEIKAAEFVMALNSATTADYAKFVLDAAEDILLVRLRQVELARQYRDEASIVLQRATLDAENKRTE